MDSGRVYVVLCEGAAGELRALDGQGTYTSLSVWTGCASDLAVLPNGMPLWSTVNGELFSTDGEVGSGPPEPLLLAAFEDTVVYGSRFGGEVAVVDLSSGETVNLVPARDTFEGVTLTGLETSAGSVFWMSTDGGGSVWEWSSEAGKANVLTDNQGALYQLAVSEQFVFWVAEGAEPCTTF